MYQTIKKLFELLTPGERRRDVFLLCMIVVMALLYMVGIGARLVVGYQRKASQGWVDVNRPVYQAVQEVLVVSKMLKLVDWNLWYRGSLPIQAVRWVQIK